MSVQAVSGNFRATAPALLDGQHSELWLDANAALLVKEFAPLANEWTYAAATGGISNTTTAVTIKAGVAGKINYLVGLDVSTDGALGTATEIAIRDGAGGTVLWRMKIGTACLQQGRNIQFLNPLRNAAVNTLLEVVTLTATTTGLVHVNAQGYTI